MAHLVELRGRAGGSIRLAMLIALLSIPGLSQGATIEAALFPDGLPQFAGTKPSAGFTSTPSDSTPPQAILFFALADQQAEGARPVQWWAAHRTIFRDGVREVVWADSRRCPQLIPALTRMTWIAAPRLDVNGLQPSAPIRRYQADGVQYILWSSASVQPDGSPLEVAISGTGGGLQAWAVETQNVLKSCWTTREPPLPLRR